MGFGLALLTLTASGIGGQDEQRIVDTGDLRERSHAIRVAQRLADDGGLVVVPVATPTVAPDAGTPTPELVPNAAEVEPDSGIPEPFAPVEALSDIEQTICAYEWNCGEALSVAACESGPDYLAGDNGSGHVGTFQISYIHAGRFAARGWDFWTDAFIPERNIAVAFDLWTEQGWRPWACA